MPIVGGSGSVTVSGVAGELHKVTWVEGHFDSTGPATGVLQLKDNGTVVWEADVSGGFHFQRPGGWDFAAGHSITLALSGGSVRLAYLP